MFLYADCNVTVKPLFGQWYSFLTVLDTEMEKNIYIITYTQWTIEEKFCNKVSLKRFLRKLNNFARPGREKNIWLSKVKLYNSYVKLDIEWNISDFICKEK
jgi:hypothetical protein